MTIIMGTLYEDEYTFKTIPRPLLLRMRNFSDKSCRKIRAQILCSITSFFFFENPAVYEIMWKNVVGPDRPQMTIWRMRIAY